MSNEYSFKALQAAAAATGDGETLECVDGDGLTLATAVLQVAGTFVGTVTFEGSVDGSNWIAVQGTNLNSGAAASTATAAGLFRFAVAGLAALRARVSAYTSGAITVTACGVTVS